MKSNCINCNERHPGCHDHCQSYQDARKAHEEMKEKKRERDLGYKLAADVQRTAVRKWNRHKPRK